MPAVKNVMPLYQLNKDEMNDPQLVLDELFDFADLTDIRELLWCWLKVSVTGNSYHKQLSASERMAVISLYEKLCKLVEAAHVMHVDDRARKDLSRKSAKK